MVAQSTSSDATVASSSDETSNSRSETIQYLTRLFTILCFASIYVLIRARRKRSLAIASGRDGGEVSFSPAEIGATVSLAASLAWLFILLPILGFGGGNKVSRSRRRRGFESKDWQSFFFFLPLFLLCLNLTKNSFLHGIDTYWACFV